MTSRRGAPSRAFRRWLIFCDRLVDPDVLEVARRDAERVFVGKAVGADVWPQDRICALIVAEPGRSPPASCPASCDPGVTAASAASAAHGQSLTRPQASRGQVAGRPIR